MYAAALLVLSVSVAAPKLKDKPPQAPPIYGEWVRVGHTEAGAPVAPDNPPHRQVFTADGQWDYYYGDKGTPGGMSFVVDPRQGPPTIDIHMNAARLDSYRGIYKVEGDTLTLCLVRGDRD